MKELVLVLNLRKFHTFHFHHFGDIALFILVIKRKTGH